MPTRKSTTGSELFIVDNSDMDWKVLRYLHDWCQLSSTIDIATGYFEIGALLALKDEWQKVDHIRVLMGDEVSRRTMDAFVDALTRHLDASVEAEKQKNDFLVGVAAIVAGIRSKKIECRVYRKEKFHAKAYITHARLEVVGSSALVGSSNFTYPGLTENIELNVQITGGPVKVLQEWYEEHWAKAENVSADVLRVIERHIREYSPFLVYAKSLQEYFKGHEMTASEWEVGGGARASRMYPVLDQYQRDGYNALLKIAENYRGAFLCDGVGLGKTFVGLMLIERLVEYDRKRVALIVPKAGRKPVWEAALNKYLRHISGIFSNLVIINHTDLQRGGEYPEKLERIKEMADAIIIDEAHHFRNPGTLGIGPRTRPSRYRNLFDICDGKQMFLLTATPVNNRLIDLQHMIELFSRKQADYFKAAPLGIHSLPGHFRTMEKDLENLVAQKTNDGETETNPAEAAQVLSSDNLFQRLVVQRSRAYVKRSQQQYGGNQAMFPDRAAPQVADYSVKKTYGKLLTKLESAFSKEKPLFSLAIYYPLAFYRGPDSTIDPLEQGRQRQIVRLIRTQFLKRFESSAHAFEASCHTLLTKLLAWITKHAETAGEKRNLERWIGRHSDLIGYVRHRQQTLIGAQEDEEDDDLVSEEMLEDIEELKRTEYDVEAMLDECYNDLDQLVDFLTELKKFEPKHDDKLKALIKLLKTDPVLKSHRCLIFTEYAATARYLKGQLAEAGIKGVDEIDSGIKRDRGEMILQFAPYYNGASSAKLKEMGLDEIRILISTDVLSEGLNLQDAMRLINYDLHWNPVRLMQRIGRVDRRMSPAVEAALVADHPEKAELRGKIVYWNFLPPDELDDLLRLYSRVSHKTLRISKTFGIEGKKLLRPEDDYEALKDFTQAYEGTPTPVEEMHLAYQKLLQDDPTLESSLNALPGRVFSGKENLKPGTQAVFFCYALPAPPQHVPDMERGGELLWTEQAGETKWYLYDVASGNIIEEPTAIFADIKCEPPTPRRRAIPDATLSEVRGKVEKHIKNTYLKAAQAPADVRPILKAWMELN
ncbi:MAG TPA: helicase-related protein [Phycisphaerae bacterium]|nr:helicase-related protein [Phycisphaerae bacterium]